MQEFDLETTHYALYFFMGMNLLATIIVVVWKIGERIYWWRERKMTRKINRDSE